jgi:hypothetical protein
MIYLFLVLSLALNILLVWYIKKLLNKYWSDIEVRDRFTNLLEQYSVSLQSIYRLEEFYGEETLKKAINETRFVVEACQEYKKILETEIDQKEEGQGYQEDDDEDQEESEEGRQESQTIKIKEGEKITQDAATYKRIVTDF